jgi:hypothetical protein
MVHDFSANGDGGYHGNGKPKAYVPSDAERELMHAVLKSKPSIFRAEDQRNEIIDVLVARSNQTELPKSIAARREKTGQELGRVIALNLSAPDRIGDILDQKSSTITP